MITNYFQYLLKLIICTISLNRIRQKEKGILSKAKANKFLIIIASGIGDALMATPLIFAVRSKFPDAYIDVLCNKKNSPVFTNNENINRLSYMQSNKKLLSYLRLVWRLRKEKFDISLSAIPGNTRQMMLLPFLAGARYRIKHERDFSGEEFRDFNFLFHQLVPIPEGRHRVDSNLDLLRALGIELNAFEPELYIPISDDDKKSGICLLKQNGWDGEKSLIGFHPGCYGVAYGEKRWPWQRFAELGNRLQDKYNVKIVFVGGKEEIKLCQQIADQMIQKPINLAGQCSLKETTAVIEKCRLFVSNDSGIMHLAEAVNTPIVAIFGPTDERQIGPYNLSHLIIKKGSIISKVLVEDILILCTKKLQST